MNLLKSAMLLAIEQHAGSRNKHDGEVYLKHVARVAFETQEDALGSYSPQDIERLVCIAWLHDIVEDTDITLVELEQQLNLDTSYQETFSVHIIINAIDLLTKRGDSNEEYYHRIAPNKYAKFVKIRDMRDNFRRNHLIKDEATRARMAKKYSLGMDILGGQ